MNVEICSIGTATAKHSIDQESAAELCRVFSRANEEQSRQLSVLYRHTRVRSRSSVLIEDDNGRGAEQRFYPPPAGEGDRGPTTEQRMQRYARDAAPLAVSAVRSALEKSSTNSGEITQLVTVSCTGFIAPGVDHALIRQLGFSKTVGRTHVGFMGCHGALNGLRVASAFVRANPDEKVLLCAVELCSLHLHYGWDPEKLVANALFADGAAAVVIAAPEQSLAEGWKLRASGSCLLPDSADAMTWRIGNHGFEMTLSPQVPELIETHLRPWIEDWLSKHQLTLSDISSWAVHPGGPRVLSAVERSLGLERVALSASRGILAEQGNMSSPTILFILERLRFQGARRPCVALAFGPGLVVEAALFV